jgi:hypothetical protein
MFHEKHGLTLQLVSDMKASVVTATQMLPMLRFAGVLYTIWNFRFIRFQKASSYQFRFIRFQKASSYQFTKTALFISFASYSRCVQINGG